MGVALELYGAATGNSIRAAISLEESGLPYVAHRVDLRAGEHSIPSFLALNPAGKVPVLVDTREGDEELVLTQSNAIMLHIAQAAPDKLFSASSAAGRARLFERLFYFVTDVIAPSHAAFALREGQFGSAPAVMTARAIQNMEAAERFLLDGGYMAGDHFSIVDIAAVTICSTLASEMDWTTTPRLKAWFERIADRPSVVQGRHVFDAGAR